MADIDAQNTYVIRPNYQDKFRPTVVQEVIHGVLQDFFEGKVYSSEDALKWSQDICAEVKTRIKDLNLDRYKIVVQAVIGEQRGEGVKMACRCLWDSDTDQYCQDVFMNDSLFCVCAAWGIYYY